MSVINDFAGMCLGTIGLSFFIMLFAANASRAIKKGMDEDE